FGGVYTDRTVTKSKNIFWTEGKITANARAVRSGHRGAVVWLTGLSGAGKSTIAQSVERELFLRGMHTYVLDGDNIRHGLNSNLGFSPEDREIVVRTDQQTVDESVATILEQLLPRLREYDVND